MGKVWLKGPIGELNATRSAVGIMLGYRHSTGIVLRKYSGVHKSLRGIYVLDTMTPGDRELRSIHGRGFTSQDVRETIEIKPRTLFIDLGNDSYVRGEADRISAGAAELRRSVIREVESMTQGVRHSIREDQIEITTQRRVLYRRSGMLLTTAAIRFYARPPLNMSDLYEN